MKQKAKLAPAPAPQPVTAAPATMAEIQRTANPSIGRMETVHWAKCRPSPTNPRKSFPEGPLNALADTIRNQGIIVPLLVRERPATWKLHAPDLELKKWTAFHLDGRTWEFESEDSASEMLGREAENYFEIIAGHRRHRAAEIAGLKTVPVIIRDLTDDEVLEVQHLENVQREDVSPLEQGASFRKLLDTNKWTAKSLAEKFGIRRSTVFARMKLCEADDDTREALENGKIDSSLAGIVLKVPLKQRRKFLEKVTTAGECDPEKNACGAMSVRAATRLLLKEFMRPLSDAKWELGDAALCPQAGSCAQCPKRSGNARDEYPEIQSPDVCTDPVCFEQKAQARIDAMLAKAAADGTKVLTAQESKGLFQWGDVRRDSGYVGSKSTCYSDPDKRSYGELTRKSDVPKVIAVNPETGELVDLLPAKETQLALSKQHKWAKEAEAKQAERGQASGPAAEAARELADQRERAADWSLLAAVGDKVAKTPATEKEMHKLLVNLVTLVNEGLVVKGDGETPECWVLQRRGVTLDGFAKMETSDLRAALTMMLLANEYREEIAGDAGQALALWGLDAKAVRAKAQKEFDEANRLPKEGEEIAAMDKELLEKVKASGSSDTIISGKVRGVFAFRGKLWVALGGSSGGNGRATHSVWQIIAEEAYKGKPRTYADLNPKDGYEGIPVKCGKDAWVLTRPKFTLIDGMPKPETEPKAKEKTKKKK